jgi:hypothetical protein
MMIYDPKAFVLMSFQSEFDSIYGQVIKPALEECGFRVERADSIIDRRNILKDIIERISGADLIIADLTSANANVLYELGISHGLKVPTIMIAQSLEEIPFDLRSYRLIVYSVRFDEIQKLRQELINIGYGRINEKLEFQSPVTDFAIIKTAALSADTQPVASEEKTDDASEDGFMDVWIKLDENIKKYEFDLSIIAKATAEIGQKITHSTEELNTINRNPGPGNASAFYKVTNALAKKMQDYSNELDSALPSFEESMNMLMDIMSGLHKFLIIMKSEKSEPKDKFRDMLCDLIDSIVPTITSVRQFRAVLAGSKGVTKEMNKGISQVERSLDKILAIMEKSESFITKMIQSIETN